MAPRLPASVPYLVIGAGVHGLSTAWHLASRGEKVLVVEEAAERVYNFLHTLTLEVQMLARACGKTNVHSLEPEDLCALTMEAAAMAKVPLAGTEYIPGVTEERALKEVKRMLEKHLEYPVDYLPASEEAIS